METKIVQWVHCDNQIKEYNDKMKDKIKPIKEMKDKLSDEIKITVIATGLNNNEQPEFYDNNQDDNITNKYLMHSTTIEESKQNTINNEVNLSKSMSDIKEEEKQPAEEVKNVENKDNMLQFGENLDIPTFLRNRKI